MFVILDTTEFYDVPQVDSNSFRVLQEYLHRTNSQLLVPEIVFSEVINHAREQIFKIDADIRNDFFPIAGSRERFAEAVRSGKKSDPRNHLRGSSTKNWRATEDCSC